MLSKLKGLFIKPQTQSVSNAEKIDGYKQQIGTALGLFHNLRNELKEVNEGLTEIVQSSEVEIEKLKLDINNAKAEIDENADLIVKVEAFIK